MNWGTLAFLALIALLSGYPLAVLPGVVLHLTFWWFGWSMERRHQRYRRAVDERRWNRQLARECEQVERDLWLEDQMEPCVSGPAGEDK